MLPESLLDSQRYHILSSIERLVPPSPGDTVLGILCLVEDVLAGADGEAQRQGCRTLHEGGSGVRGTHVDEIRREGEECRADNLS